MPSSKLKVFWTTTAQNDLLRIIEFVADDSVTNAKKIFNKLKEKAQKLDQFPEIGQIVLELKYHNINNIRELSVTPWRIFYKIESRTVFVLAVIDARRNVEDILLDRFM